MHARTHARTHSHMHAHTHAITSEIYFGGTSYSIQDIWRGSEIVSLKKYVSDF